MPPFITAPVSSADAFKELVSKIESTSGYRKPIGFGVCRIEKGQLDAQKILTCTYPVINWGENFGSAAVFLAAAGIVERTQELELVAPLTLDFLAQAMDAFAPFVTEAQGEKHRNVQVVQSLQTLIKGGKASADDFRVVFLFEDKPPQTVPGIYLKLMALSSGKAPLRGLNLDGIFGKLENVAWAGHKPYELAWLREYEIDMKLAGTYPAIEYVDKFPRYLMHVIPVDNTRILDGSKVRFGAQLAAGTTVMPGASYINFNAGTLGPAMVEGRISSSAIVGANSDVGGGASILGVLSGGNANPISVGEKCLLGANSVTGIPLGHGCIVDAGVSVLAGTRVFLADSAVADVAAVNPGWDLKTMAVKHHADLKMHEFKAASLTHGNGLHFRVDSGTGRMMISRSKREIPLNAILH